MLQLDLKKRPEWHDLGHGVRVKLRPMGSSMMVAARNDPAVQKLGDKASDEEAGLAFGKALARAAIMEWEGVADETGKPLPVSPEAVDALMEIFPIFDAFQSKYVSKGLLLEQEKNASAPLPSGSSVGATDTAKRAKGSAKNARKG